MINKISLRNGKDFPLKEKFTFVEKQVIKDINHYFKTKFKKEIFFHNNFGGNLSHEEISNFFKENNLIEDFFFHITRCQKPLEENQFRKYLLTMKTYEDETFQQRSVLEMKYEIFSPKKVELVDINICKMNIYRFNEHDKFLLKYFSKDFHEYKAIPNKHRHEVPF